MKTKGKGFGGIEERTFTEKIGTTPGGFGCFLPTKGVSPVGFF